MHQFFYIFVFEKCRDFETRVTEGHHSIDRIMVQ